MIERIKGWVGRYTAVGICLLWFVWDVSTAFAYIDNSPTQLQLIESFLPVHIWVVWAIASGFLLFGVALPAKGSKRRLDVVIALRSIGMGITALLLAAWGMGFILSDAERGWVSGKNYLIMAVCVLILSYLVSRLSVREG